MAAAARALGLPSSTVSRKLGLLEARLETQLLNRTTRTLHLSEDGRVVLARVRRILDEAEATEAALERSTKGLSGLVKIGVPSVLTRDLLQCLAAVLGENPGLRLQVSVHDRPVNPVAEGLDLVVSGGGLVDSSLVARALGQVQLVLAASAGYLERRGRPKTPPDLLQHDTCHFRTNPPASSWELYDRQGERHNVPIEVKLESTDGRALLDAMHADLCIGTLSKRLLRSNPSLERVLPGFSFRPFPVRAVFPASSRRSARLLAIVGALKTALER